MRLLRVPIPAPARAPGMFVRNCSLPFPIEVSCLENSLGAETMRERAAAYRRGPVTPLADACGSEAFNQEQLRALGIRFEEG